MNYRVMTDKEYQQKKRECFVKFCKDNGIDQEVNISIFDAFDQIFDRAYALGKQTETISQEEIEKASVEYANKTAKQYEVCNSEFVQEIMVAFEQGVNFALGKQEKDAEDDRTLKVNRQLFCQLCANADDYINEHLEEEDSDYTYYQGRSDALHELYRGECKDAEETVISGWVARDKSGYLVLHYKKPHRTFGNAKWYSAQSQKSLPRDSFSDLTWESEPIKVNISIKRE